MRILSNLTSENLFIFVLVIGLSVPVLAGKEFVLFLGKTRAGKSTITKVLKNPFMPAREMSIFSDTRLSASDSIVIDGTEIVLIDNPGFFEITSRNSNQPRTLKDLCEEIRNGLPEGMQNARLTVIVPITVESGIDIQDMESIKLSLQILGELVEENVIAGYDVRIVITRAEGYREDTRNRHVKDLLQLASKIVPFPHSGSNQSLGTQDFFFSGAVLASSLGIHDNGTLGTIHEEQNHIQVDFNDLSDSEEEERTFNPIFWSTVCDNFNQIVAFRQHLLEAILHRSVATENYIAEFLKLLKLADEGNILARESVRQQIAWLVLPLTNSLHIENNRNIINSTMQNIDNLVELPMRTQFDVFEMNSNL